jgi:threonine dehydratase
MVTVDDVRKARARIASYIHCTPIMTSQMLNEICGCELFFKCENLQKAGAFKSRGAVNAVMMLPDEVAAKGVATHSSGNHGSALARAAQLRGVPAYIVVPSNARAVKKAAIEQYGGQIIECEPTLAAREDSLQEVVDRTGAAFVPPYDDDRIIAGQATAMLELVEQVEGLESVIVPVGGGGLLAGTSIISDAHGIETWGAEPSGADDAHRSFHSGDLVRSHVPNTMADGLLTTLGERNFEIIHSLVRDILLVEETEIIDAMRLLWTRLKIVVEPSSAVAFAAILRNPDTFRGERIDVILTGGNVDLADLRFM